MLNKIWKWYLHKLFIEKNLDTLALTLVFIIILPIGVGLYNSSKPNIEDSFTLEEYAIKLNNNIKACNETYKDPIRIVIKKYGSSNYKLPHDYKWLLGIAKDYEKGYVSKEDAMAEIIVETLYRK